MKKNISASSPSLNLLNARNNIQNISSIRLRRAVLMAIDLADGKYENAVTNLEKWFNTATERISGQYKSLTAKIIFIVAFVITLSLNINTITLIDYIYRQNASTHIATSVGNPNGGIVGTSNENRIVGIPRVPIGWNSSRSIGNLNIESVKTINWLSLVNSFLGILITAFAASLGAPFWFDLLSKIVQLRTSIPPRNVQSSMVEPTQPQVQLPVQLGTGTVLATPDDTDPDDENDEGFDGVVVNITKDENLPPAMGGVK